MTKKLKIGIDIDNVISDTYPTFIKKFNSTFGKNFQYEEITDFYYLERKSEVMGIDKSTISKFINDLLLDENFQMRISPIGQAREVITRWSRQGYSIRYITARPFHMKINTMKWLTKHRFLLNGVFLDFFPEATHNFDNRHKAVLYKKEIAHQQNIDIFIEDSREIAEVLDIPVLLMDRPWNQGELPKNIRRVKDWMEISHIIDDDIMAA